MGDNNSFGQTWFIKIYQIIILKISIVKISTFISYIYKIMNQSFSVKQLDVETVIIGSRKIHADKLPIRAYKNEIFYSIERFQTTVIVAETGSGKTTCKHQLSSTKEIPQYLVEAGYCPPGEKVVVSLPRRMGAISIAQRVSEEYGTQLGEQVGYRVRFDIKVTEDTKIEYVTDGMLIQLIMSNPLLHGYSVIMIDDVHERTVNTDLLLALVKKILRKRKDVKLIISSATLSAKEMADYFTEKNNKASILSIKGRTFQVDVGSYFQINLQLHYLTESCKNYIVAAVETVQKIHREKTEGDILVFLTSAEEISIFLQMMEGVQQKAKNKMHLLPLYANLSLEKQLDIFKPSPNNQRKVIASTNIAESSITIDGIVFVVDCLHQKVKAFDYKKNFESMKIVPISLQQSQQRAGRAGRTRNGHCFRLATKELYDTLVPVFPPEITRCQLNDLILSLKVAQNNYNWKSFSLDPTSLCSHKIFLTPVQEEQLVHPLNSLLAFQMIIYENEKLGITPLGESVVEYPLNSNLALCVEKSLTEDFQCSQEIIKIVSMLSIQGGVFFGEIAPLTIIKAKKAFGCKEGDQLSLCNILTRFQMLGNKGGWCEQYKINRARLDQADKVYKQIVKLKGKKNIKSSVDDFESIIRCLLTGFFMQVAQRQLTGQAGMYKNIFNNEIMHIHSNSILTLSYPEWVVYNELVEQCIIDNLFFEEGKLVMRDVTELDPHWLFEIAPHFFKDVRKDQAVQKHSEEQQKLNEWEEKRISEEQQKLMEQYFLELQFIFKGKEKQLLALSKERNPSKEVLLSNQICQSKIRKTASEV